MGVKKFKIEAKGEKWGQGPQDLGFRGISAFASPILPSMGSTWGPPPSYETKQFY
jgi:hypothetical protein